MIQRKSLRAVLREHKPLVTPAAHDALSARLIEEAGFPAVGLSGSALVAARYGLPDLGLVGIADMAAAFRDILAAISIPVSVDGDDGYGDAKSVVRMVRLYESLGIGSITLEDQSSAEKQPGEEARGIVTLAEFTGKLRAACETRSDKEAMMIVGRTDAYLVAGMDEALRRGDAILKAGADGLFVPGIKNLADLERIGRTFKGAYLPTVITDLSGANGPTLAELHAMGYGRVTIPSLVVLEATRAINEALRKINAFTDGSGPRPAMADAAAIRDTFRQAVRLPEWQEIEKRYVPAP